ncbi:XRE family transcriptional regulator [Streptomyces sp. WAC00469]|nr:XRE family transcriptional regulator [Streptomyces sp. WAC00469]
MPGRRHSPKPPDAQLAFAAELRELRRRTYRKPTEEAFARKMGCARSTVSAILNGRRFPTWEHTAAFVEACGADPSKWRERWLQVNREIEEAAKGQAVPVTPLPFLGGPEAEADAMLAVHWYRNNREFYEAASARVQQARSEIRVTYTRRYPPTQYTTPASARYFKTIMEWAGEKVTTNEASDASSASPNGTVCPTATCSPGHASTTRRARTSSPTKRP